MKKILLSIILVFFTAQTVFCAQFDSSVDADIRKQYKVEELPALPKVSPSNHENILPKPTAENYTGKIYTIKGGTKFVLISKNKLADWNNQGAKITFVSQNEIITKEGAIIPSGTVLKGTVRNSHGAQITGNGGLIQLKVDEIIYKGMPSFINTKIIEVNSKRVYNGKLKGKRKYWKNCAKAMTPGKKTFKVMHKATKKMLPVPIINILSIVPFTIGGVVYLVNLPIAPIASVFMKGGNISIPAGTFFIISVSGNNQIRG